MRIVLDVIYVLGALITGIGGCLMLTNVRRWPKLVGSSSAPVGYRRVMGLLLSAVSLVLVISVLWWPFVFVLGLFSGPLIFVQGRINRSVGLRKNEMDGPVG
ncbi:hypothetical protein GCM10029978_103800 [Actinoallomurus acanthiterrae]